MSTTETEIPEDERRLRRGLDLLFSKYLDQDPADELQTAGAYFEFLASRINYSALDIDVDPILLNKFEVIWLMLEDRLLPYPEKIKEQLHSLLRGDELSETFAAFSQFDSDDLQGQRLDEVLEALPSPVAWLVRLFRRKALSRRAQSDVVTVNRLFAARTALLRAANILSLASTINFVDYDTSLRDFKDHYNPRLIDKNRLSALVGLLKVQVQDLPDSDVRKRLLERLEELEEEIRKERPRWGAVIAGFFILFGFVADLKTVEPQVYAEPYRVLETIVRVLHDEARVQTATERTRLLPESGIEDEGEDGQEEDDKRRQPSAVLPPRNYHRKGEEVED